MRMNKGFLRKRSGLKRYRGERTDTESNCKDIIKDIISTFPETIIAHILSFLPTKDALRTCLLSKAWKHKWNSIYNIDIDDGERFSTTSNEGFMKFVFKVMFSCNCRNIQRFRLSCLRHQYDPGLMLAWVAFAIGKKVEDLEIAYAHENLFFHSDRFDRTSITKLKLQMPGTFRVRTPIRFSNLKMLHFAEVKILGSSSAHISQLRFDFPVMETLELRNCIWFKVNFVEINSPALTKCHVIWYSDNPEVDKCQIKIYGAKLLKFEFYGRAVENFDLSSSTVFLAAVASCGYADDNQVIGDHGLQARLFLKGLHGLNHFKLSGVFAEAIAQAKKGPPLPKFNMLRRLELLTRCNSGALLKLLHATPFLELIVLHMGLQDDYDYDGVVSVPSCIVSHLNEVHFSGFSGRGPDVHMADFLLNNAVVLKKMLGLFRNRSEERHIERNFWAKLKSVFKDGDFVVGSSVKDMADFELEFG